MTVGLLRYLVVQAARSASLIAAVVFVLYVVWYTIPLDPAYNVLAPSAPPAALARVDHDLGVDRPLVVQYLHYLNGLAHGSLGHDFAGPGRVTQHASVRSELVDPLRVTGWLVLGGMALVLLVAIPLGAVAALHHRRTLDRAILLLCLALASLPAFFVATLLISKAAPALGVGAKPGLALSSVDGPNPSLLTYCTLTGPPTGLFGGSAPCHGPGPWAAHLALPWVAFLCGLLALYVRMVRAGLLEAMQAPHVVVARAKGAGELRILRSHVGRFVVPLVANMAASDVPIALGVALFIELVFGLPGIGMKTYEASVAQQPAIDLPVIAGVSVIAAVVCILLRFLAAVVAALADPRIREPIRIGE